MTHEANKSRSGCCAALAPPTPEEIRNRHGLASIRYRVGTFGSFRQAMIQSIARNPQLSAWTARTSDDYGIALLDMWAYVGDILTFYQERIANEAYLPTAVQRASALRLSALLGYRPAPGVAAETRLAFTVGEGKEVQIPKGLRVQSVPEPGETPQKFETVEASVAKAEWNELRPRLDEALEIGRGLRKLYLEGVDTGLQPGDGLLLVGDERRNDPGSERWDFRILQTVEAFPEEGHTIVTWDRELGHDKPTVFPADNPEIYALRQRAALFGHNAPDWNAMPEEIRKAYGGSNWESLGQWPDYEVFEGDTVDLDTVYPKIVIDSWAVLSRPGYVELYWVKQADVASRINFTLTSKITRLTLDAYEHLTWFPLRHTVVFVQSELLRAVPPPRTTHVEKESIELDRIVPGLEEDHVLLVQGERVDRSGETSAELAVISEVADDGSHTAITLRDSLQQTYRRASVRIYANVVRATHGETVADEVLGSGDAATPLQVFSLKKAPVTFIPDPSATHGAANTLAVRVDGVEWDETPTLYGHEADERIYTTATDGDETMTVQFGDGATGSRLPTGVGNIAAEYRHGIGPGGNVGACSLTTLLDRPLGLKAVTNPTEAQGGASAETRDGIRRSAPNTVRIFDRVVSLRDFANAALAFVGVSKARATITWRGEEECVRLVVAGDEGKVVGTETISNLRSYLDGRRDPNRRLEIESYVPVAIEVKGIVQVDPSHDEETVQQAAIAALLEHLAFDNRDLGQSVHLSDLYRVLQGVTGVTALRIDVLQFKSEAGHTADREIAEKGAERDLFAVDLGVVDPVITSFIEEIQYDPLRLDLPGFPLLGPITVSLADLSGTHLPFSVDQLVAAEPTDRLHWRLPIHSNELATLGYADAVLKPDEVHP